MLACSTHVICSAYTVGKSAGAGGRPRAIVLKVRSAEQQQAILRQRKNVVQVQQLWFCSGSELHAMVLQLLDKLGVIAPVLPCGDFILDGAFQWAHAAVGLGAVIERVSAQDHFRLVRAHSAVPQAG